MPWLRLVSAGAHPAGGGVWWPCPQLSLVSNYSLLLTYCNIRRDVRVCFTKLRLSSHKFLVERARWLKVKVPYTQRTCTLCNSNDIEDEYHVTLVCEYFRDVRKKYIKPFYYQRPNIMKFLDLMTSVSKKDRFRLMLFLKVVFKMYAETL